MENPIIGGDSLTNALYDSLLTAENDQPATLVASPVAGVCPTMPSNVDQVLPLGTPGNSLGLSYGGNVGSSAEFLLDSSCPVNENGHREVVNGNRMGSSPSVTNDDIIMQGNIVEWPSSTLASAMDDEYVIATAGLSVDQTVSNYSDNQNLVSSKTNREATRVAPGKKTTLKRHCDQCNYSANSRQVCFGCHLLQRCFTSCI